MKSFTSPYNQDHPRDKGDGRKTRVNKSTNGKAMSDPKKLPSAENEIGMIIHEIRNPLTAISLANQSLYEEIGHDHLSPSLHTASDIIAKNITRIEVLLKELLHATCKQMEFGPTDICHVINSSLKKAD